MPVDQMLSERQLAAFQAVADAVVYQPCVRFDNVVAAAIQSNTRRQYLRVGNDPNGPLDVSLLNTVVNELVSLGLVARLTVNGADTIGLTQDGRSCPDLSSPLLTGLLSAWELESNLADGLGVNDLTGVGTWSFSGGGVSFPGGAGNYLTCADTAALRLVGTSYSLAVMVSFNTAAGQTLMSKSTANVGGWLLSVVTGPGGRRAAHQVYDPALRRAVEVAAMSTGTWYTVVGMFDADTGTLDVRIDDGSAQTASAPTGPATLTVPFQIGSNGTTGLNGTVKRARIWTRLLEADEIGRACYAFPQFIAP